MNIRLGDKAIATIIIAVIITALLSSGAGVGDR